MAIDYSIANKLPGSTVWVNNNLSPDAYRKALTTTPGLVSTITHLVPQQDLPKDSEPRAALNLGDNGSFFFNWISGKEISARVVMIGGCEAATNPSIQNWFAKDSGQAVIAFGVKVPGITAHRYMESIAESLNRGVTAKEALSELLVKYPKAEETYKIQIFGDDKAHL